MCVPWKRTKPWLNCAHFSSTRGDEDEDLAKWDVETALSFDFKADEPYDILVTELFGSMTNSESLYVYYVWDLFGRGIVRIVRNHGSADTPRYWVVPQASAMTVGLYRCPQVSGICTGTTVDMDDLYYAVHGCEESKALNWTQDEAIKVFISLC